LTPDEALLLKAQIAAFKRPSNRAYSAFSSYIAGNTTGGVRLPIISGRAKTFLQDRDDLVALKKPVEEDALSRLLRDHWTFQRRATEDPLDRTTIYRGQNVIWTVTGISMFVAAILMILAITTLYLVSNQVARLCMVLAYTLVFALSVALLTNAKRVEIYGSTAAYAAVLVVFISGGLGLSNPQQCFVQISEGMYKTVTCPK
jgi:hypothetical protein